MRIERGDLWERWDEGSKIVITTNIGWDPVTLRNNMGAGIALEAMRRWPWLPEWYGRFCRATFPHTPVIEHDQLRLIFLPVKPLLNRNNPEISWDQRASVFLVVEGLKQLRHHAGHIALGFPGCGNGGLEPIEVLPHIERQLDPTRFVVRDRQGVDAVKPERLL